MKKIYLAIPFIGMGEDLSFKCANEVAALLIIKGMFIFSPISHSYPIWKTGLVGHTHEIWLPFDKPFVDWCDELFIINVIDNNIKDGLELIKNSKGVQQEIIWAKEQNKPIKIINYNTTTKILN